MFGVNWWFVWSCFFFVFFSKSNWDKCCIFLGVKLIFLIVWYSVFNCFIVFGLGILLSICIWKLFKIFLLFLIYVFKKEVFNDCCNNWIVCFIGLKVFLIFFGNKLVFLFYLKCNNFYICFILMKKERIINVFIVFFLKFNNL